VTGAMQLIVTGGTGFACVSLILILGVLRDIQRELRGLRQERRLP
jgi:hypothetical protein